MPNFVDAVRAEVVGKVGRGGLHHRVDTSTALAEYQQRATKEDRLEQQLKL